MKGTSIGTCAAGNSPTREYNGYRIARTERSRRIRALSNSSMDCDLQDRKFLAKTYVFPIPYDELANNSAIEQYDEWK